MKILKIIANILIAFESLFLFTRKNIFKNNAKMIAINK